MRIFIKWQIALKNTVSIHFEQCCNKEGNTQGVCFVDATTVIFSHERYSQNYFSFNKRKQQISL